MSDMNLEPGCDTCEHIADIRGITLTNTHWFTQSAVDELTAGLRATLEARTAALTRTIERAEKAEAERDELRANYMLATDAKRLNDRYAKSREAVGRERARAEKAEATLRQVAALADEWERVQVANRDAMENRTYFTTFEPVSDLRAALMDQP